MNLKMSSKNADQSAVRGGGGSTMNDAPAILIVDDDPVVAESLSEFFEGEGYATATALDGKEALRLLESNVTISAAERGEVDPAVNGNGRERCRFGLVVTELNLPRCDGLELLREVRKDHPSVASIVVTGFGKIELAVEAVKLGAVDFLTKPVVEDELRIAVGKAVQQHALLAENQTLRSQLSERYGLGNMIGHDYRMQKVYELVEAVAPSKTTVVINGDSGTGKTMVARAIHTSSNRSAGPFVTFSCGAIPETLLESELFGHVKGAFTGAVVDKAGRILAANGGTLFIDEINSATPALQLKLLRVLQEKQFEPVGSSETVFVDVRFVLATNQSLRELVESGMFREDLYYRINVVNIHLPPLRDRVGDIPMLVNHFLVRYCQEVGKTVTGLTERALEALRRYGWPGNVRELENAIERAVVLSRRPVIDLEDLPDTIHWESRSPGVEEMKMNGGHDRSCIAISALRDGWTPMPLAKAMQDPERQILLAALMANSWNRQMTARELDINRTTLYKKIKLYGLDQPQ